MLEMWLALENDFLWCDKLAQEGIDSAVHSVDDVVHAFVPEHFGKTGSNHAGSIEFPCCFVGAFRNAVLQRFISESVPDFDAFSSKETSEIGLEFSAFILLDELDLVASLVFEEGNAGNNELG